MVMSDTLCDRMNALLIKDVRISFLLKCTSTIHVVLDVTFLRSLQ